MKVITKKHQNDILDDVIKLYGVMERNINDLNEYAVMMDCLANINLLIGDGQTLRELVADNT